MAFSIKKIADLVVNVAYPPLCAHCQAVLAKRLPLFCATCLEQISLIEGQEKCRTCFAELYKGRCERCSKRPVVIHRQFAACEAMGPGRALLNALKNGRRECVPAAASLMAYQWFEQKMPLPDFLIPLPAAFWQKQKHGFDANFLLASELGKIFSVPVRSALKRKFDRTHFLTQGDFRACFELKKKNKESFCDKHLVLIAPELDDAILRLAGKELRTHFPMQVNALAFANFI